ncbi:hypothetical protein [Saccharothrix sp. HUAS TT1]|uniref:rhamnogalacturonan lyase family protein n=1 Tax=unclassified Saccharothrix TaxID=2593673 RepID=UPI00345BF5E0
MHLDLRADVDAPGRLVHDSTPALSADILGDWREEVVRRTSDNTRLRTYSTTDPTSVSRPSLMQDRQYRVAVAWQNTAYNQPPHPSFPIG